MNTEETTIPEQHENPNGLHGRYFIQKIVPNPKWEPGRGGPRYFKVPTEQDSEYFIMRLDSGGSDPEHIKACRIGVNAYADAIEHHLPQLAKDLRGRYPIAPRDRG